MAQLVFVLLAKLGHAEEQHFLVQHDVGAARGIHRGQGALRLPRSIDRDVEEKIPDAPVRRDAEVQDFFDFCERVAVEDAALGAIFTHLR